MFNGKKHLQVKRKLVFFDFFDFFDFFVVWTDGHRGAIHYFIFSTLSEDWIAKLVLQDPQACSYR